MLVLFTDTDTDLTPQEAKEYGYHLISMPYVIDEKEIFPYEDFEEFKAHEFYEMLRSGVMPKTCAVSPSKYVEYFEPIFARGDDILYVHFSAAMSGTFNAMHLALEELNEKYPERKFYTIDTKGITICSLNIVKEIGDMYKQGKSIEELLAWAEVEVDKFATYFYVDDLKFFQRSGRISGFSAEMGTLLGVHPIIFMDSDGQMKNIAKARGRNTTLKKIMSYIEDFGDNINDYRIIIGHTDVIDIALLMKKMIEEKFGQDLKIELVVVNPTAGSHCGPAGVGVCFHAKHR